MNLPNDHDFAIPPDDESLCGGFRYALPTLHKCFHGNLPPWLPRRSCSLIALLALLTGCTVGPDYRPPDTPLPADWQALPAGTQASTAIERQWWRHFHDPALDQLVTQAMQGNLDLKISETRIVAARASRAGALAALLPTGDLMASATRQGNQLGFPSGGPANLNQVIKQPFNIFKSGFDASWELDLFGGHRRQLEAAEAELAAADLSRQDVMISTLAEIARNYLDARLYQAQRAVAADIVASDLKSADISGQRYAAGDVSGAEVKKDHARLAHDQTQLADYDNQQAQAEYALDVLLAAPPGTAHGLLAAATPIPACGEELVFAAPAQVIANRPDIRAAERRLAAATAQQGAALARFFPDLSLSGFIGLFSTQTNNFLSTGSKSWMMGASVLWPILSYGTLAANLDAADASQQEALTQYQKSVIGALADVERAFTAYSAQQRHLAAAHDETEQYRRVHAIAMERHRQGQTASQEALDAERDLHASRTRLNQATALAAQDLVAVYKSLGGGWEPDKQPDRSNDRDE